MRVVSSDAPMTAIERGRNSGDRSRGVAMSASRQRRHIGPDIVRRAALNGERAQASLPERLVARLVAPGPEASRQRMQLVFARVAEGADDLMRDGANAAGRLA